MEISNITDSNPAEYLFLQTANTTGTPVPWPTVVPWPIIRKRYEVNWDKIELENMHLLYHIIEDQTDGSSEIRVYDTTPLKKAKLIEKMAERKWLIEMITENE